MGIVLKKIGNETNKISTRGFEPQISMNWKHPSMQNYQGTHQKKKIRIQFLHGVFNWQSLGIIFLKPQPGSKWWFKFWHMKKQRHLARFITPDLGMWPLRCDPWPLTARQGLILSWLDQRSVPQMEESGAKKTDGFRGHKTIKTSVGQSIIDSLPMESHYHYPLVN